MEVVNTVPLEAVDDAPLKPTTETKPNDLSKVQLSEMTSKDYYFDSYAHFGIHEVRFIY